MGPVGPRGHMMLMPGLAIEGEVPIVTPQGAGHWWCQLPYEICYSCLVQDLLLIKTRVTGMDRRISVRTQPLMGWGFCVSHGLWCGGENTFQQEILVGEKSACPPPTFQRLPNQDRKQAPRRWRAEVLWKMVISVVGVERWLIHERESKRGWKGEMYLVAYGCFAFFFHGMGAGASRRGSAGHRVVFG